MYKVYILQSQKDGKTYTGYTKDLKIRLEQYNAGRVLATRRRRPFELLFSEDLKTLVEAKKRELWWKSGSGRRRLREFFK